MPPLALGYGLTPPGQEMLGFWPRGMITAEMTQHLSISPHSVRDHIKALFGKSGVRSRGRAG